MPADGSDARVLGGEWAESIRKLADELDRLVTENHKYPFVAALEPLRDQVVAMVGKPAAWYITEPVKQEDALLDAKEDILDKIRSFMGGAQREIYDDVRDFLQAQEANIGYVDAAAGEKLRAALRDPDCYKGTAIQALKSDLYALKDKVELDVLKERKAVDRRRRRMSPTRSRRRPSSRPSPPTSRIRSAAAWHRTRPVSTP